MMKWFVGAILLLLISLIFNLGLLAYAMYALLGVLLVSRWLSRTWAESVHAKRECNQLTAKVGETVTVMVRVENGGRLPIAWLLIEDLLSKRALLHEPPNLRVTGRRIQLSMLRAGGVKTMLYQLECNRRGYYQLGPSVLETGDLFGLHRRYQVGSSPNYLLVYPEVVPLEGYDIASKRPIGEVLMTYRLFEDPTRISGVRRYEAGDPLNRVHWRATARTGVLQSKVYEPSTVAGATILLDFHLAAHADRHEPVRSELGITAAASIAHSVYQMGQQVGLVTNGRDAADRIRQEGWEHDFRTRDAARQAASMLVDSDRLSPVVVPTRRGPEQFLRILETLARLELTDGLSLPQLISETESRLPRDASVIVILPQVTPENAIALGNLRRRGMAVTALLNLFEVNEFAAASGPLLAEGVETRHLLDRASIATICRRFVVG
jgi:uncharacterized protein (DUF58 family)